MKDKPWLKNITSEDMPNEELKLVAAFCGVDMALELMENLSGINISIPRHPFIHLKRKYIANNYDGTTASILRIAMECGISQRYVYKVIEKPKPKS